MRDEMPLRETAIRAVIALGFFLAAGALVVAASSAAAFRDRQPDLALQLWPFDARAKARLAEQELQIGSAEDSRSRGAELARAALLRDPTLAMAWRTLALAAIAADQQREAMMYLQISQSLSGRDPTTQLLLIEDSVQRHDIDDALRHYDIALRSSGNMSDMLLPVLVSATREPVIASKVAELLSDDPPWADRYIQYFAQYAPSAEAAVRIVGSFPSETRSEHAGSLKSLINLLLDRGEYAAAAEIYSLLSGRDEVGLLRGGAFTDSSEFPPFDWELTETPDVRAEPIAQSDQADVGGLRVSAAHGAIARAARQLLILPAGQYRLQSVVGRQSEQAPDRLSWQVTCAASGQRLLTMDTTPRQEHRQRIEASFGVPASGCAAQWLQLEVAAPDTSAETEVWIHEVSVRQATPSPRGR